MVRARKRGLLWTSFLQLLQGGMRHRSGHRAAVNGNAEDIGDHVAGSLKRDIEILASANKKKRAAERAERRRTAGREKEGTSEDSPDQHVVPDQGSADNPLKQIKLGEDEDENFASDAPSLENPDRQFSSEEGGDGSGGSPAS